MKRAFDFTASLAAIILLSPLFLVIALIILISDGSPVIYKQVRIGKDKKKFTIFKFRTMKNGTRLAPTGALKESEQQIIGVGKLLRKSSLDELPQLFNILKGDMSFVGPRPLIVNEGNIHALREAAGVYTVRPGLTGWAQVNGRDHVNNEQKIVLDKEYIEKQSLLFDFKILIRTFTSVIKSKDIADGGEF